MRLRALGAALLDEIVVILIFTTISAIVSVLAWTASSLVGILISIGIVLLALAAVVAKGREVYREYLVSAKIVSERRDEVRRQLPTCSEAEKQSLRILLLKGRMTDAQVNN